MKQALKITSLKDRKTKDKKLSMVTCYDFWTAKIIAQTNIDIILVGDSLAMMMHGHATTVPATIDLMCSHIAAVAKGAPNKLIIGDMPFLSYRKSLNTALDAVEKLMQSGCHAIKLEGALGNEKLISHVVQSGIPVFGHLGLTPQSVNTLGGHTIQGRKDEQANQILSDAVLLESLGCSSVVLECIPSQLASRITKELTIPTIGIGAGFEVDGQVLVLQDLLGMDPNFNPTFLKKFLNGHQLISDALNQYHDEVQSGQFPNTTNCY